MGISGPVKADSKKEGLSPLFFIHFYFSLIFFYEVRCFFKTFTVCSDSTIAVVFYYLDIVAITEIIIFVYFLNYDFCIFFHFDFPFRLQSLKNDFGFCLWCFRSVCSFLF